MIVEARRSDPYSEEDIQIMFECLPEMHGTWVQIGGAAFHDGCPRSEFVLRSVVGMLNIVMGPG